MIHEQIEPVGVPCASGRHEDGHYVYLLDELTGVCSPPCEAAQHNRRCHHVSEAREKRARRLERARIRAAREVERGRGCWLDEIDMDGLTERIATERVLVAEGMRE